MGATVSPMGDLKPPYWQISLHIFQFLRTNMILILLNYNIRLPKKTFRGQYQLSEYERAFAFDARSGSPVISSLVPIGLATMFLY